MKHLHSLSAAQPAQIFSPGPLVDLVSNISRAYFDMKFTFMFERVPPGTGGGGGGQGNIPGGFF